MDLPSEGNKLCCRLAFSVRWPSTALGAITITAHFHKAEIDIFLLITVPDKILKKKYSVVPISYALCRADMHIFLL